MSARAISAATVSFGLVSIPIKVYSSGESSTGIRFNMLHRKCGSRLKQQYICPTDKVAPIYFEKTYYLGPDKGGDRAYKLLARVLMKSGRSALAKYAARGKQYLVLLRPMQDGMVMQQLRYADEIRSFGEVPLGDAVVKPSELKLAMQIVEQAGSDKFSPESYEDEVRNRTLALIEKKVEGQEITEEPSEQPKAQVVDLMEALKASLAKRTASGQSARRPPRKAAKASKG